MLKTIHQRKAVKALLGTTLVSLGIMAASARSASAAEIFWELRDVQGESGTYTGSFVYDVDTNIYSNIDITSSGSGLTGGDGNYLSGGALTVSSSSSSTQLILETTIGATTRTLRLFFSSALTNALPDTTVGIGFNSSSGGNSRETAVLTGPNETNQIGNNGSASVATVPEPITMLGSLVAIGGMGAGVLKRKQAQNQRAEEETGIC